VGAVALVTARSVPLPNRPTGPLDQSASNSRVYPQGTTGQCAQRRTYPLPPSYRATMGCPFTLGSLSMMDSSTRRPNRLHHMRTSVGTPKYTAKSLLYLGPIT
jgi:hypothetical protein